VAGDPRITRQQVLLVSPILRHILDEEMQRNSVYLLSLTAGINRDSKTPFVATTQGKEVHNLAVRLPYLVLSTFC
jgi:hypothetical protein